MVTKIARGHASIVKRICKLHTKADQLFGAAAIAAMEAGDLLIQVRLEMNGKWKKWVEENLPFSMRKAEAYMRLARHREQIEQWLDAQDPARLTITEALKRLTKSKVDHKSSTGRSAASSCEPDSLAEPEETGENEETVTSPADFDDETDEDEVSYGDHDSEINDEEDERSEREEVFLLVAGRNLFDTEREIMDCPDLAETIEELARQLLANAQKCSVKLKKTEGARLSEVSPEQLKQLIVSAATQLLAKSSNRPSRSCY